MTTRAEELKAIVDDAWAATAILERAPAVRGEAFKMVLEAALREESPAVSTSPHNAPSTSEQAASNCDTGEGRTTALALAFAIKREQVADLFDVRSSEPALTSFAAGQIAEDCASATREITLLVSVARNALGLSTGTWLLRDLAGYYERLDLPHFQATLDAMDEIFVRGEPGAEDRGITLRSLGFTAARELAQRMLC